MVILLLFLAPSVVFAENCWGDYDPTVQEECQYEFISEEDQQIDQWIRDNLTAWWVRKKDD